MPAVPGAAAGSHRAIRWFSWFLGLAMVAAVVVAALHFSEERAFVQMAAHAEPAWLVVARDLALVALVVVLLTSIRPAREAPRTR